MFGRPKIRVDSTLPAGSFLTSVGAGSVLKLHHAALALYFAY